MYLYLTKVNNYVAWGINFFHCWKGVTPEPEGITVWWNPHFFKKQTWYLYTAYCKLMLYLVVAYVSPCFILIKTVIRKTSNALKCKGWQNKIQDLFIFMRCWFKYCSDFTFLHYIWKVLYCRIFYFAIAIKQSKGISQS